MEFNKQLMDEALENNVINEWEYNFCEKMSDLEAPSIKQIALVDKILVVIESPADESLIEKNKKQDEMAHVIEIDKTSKDALVFEHYTDAKVGGTWFRKCESCEGIKRKETEYQSEWRKNHKRRRGGQVTYSRRCIKCEDTIGHKWGDTNLKSE